MGTYKRYLEMFEAIFLNYCIILFTQYIELLFKITCMFLLLFLVICEPPCDNGVCTEDNSCSCNVGYTGNRCNEPSKLSKVDSNSRGPSKFESS